MEPKGELVVAEGVWAVDEVCWQMPRVHRLWLRAQSA